MPVQKSFVDKKAAGFLVILLRDALKTTPRAWAHGSVAHLGTVTQARMLDSPLVLLSRMVWATSSGPHLKSKWSSWLQITGTRGLGVLPYSSNQGRFLWGVRSGVTGGIHAANMIEQTISFQEHLCSCNSTAACTNTSLRGMSSMEHARDD